MLDLTVILVVGFIVLGIYKLFELYAKRKERMLTIEKLAFLYENQEDSEGKPKIRLPFASVHDFDFGFWPLRIALLMIGIGIGCLSAFFIRIYTKDLPWDLISMANFASISIFGGIGMLIAYFIEQKKKMQ